MEEKHIEIQYIYDSLDNFYHPPLTPTPPLREYRSTYKACPTSAADVQLPLEDSFCHISKPQVWKIPIVTDKGWT